MAGARSRGAVGLGILFALALSARSPQARAQNASGDNFSLQNFRPAVDSKGYVTVNASQVLGHLEFSFGLVANYAHDVLNLEHTDATMFKSRFDVEHFLTPQL